MDSVDANRLNCNVWCHFYQHGSLCIHITSDTSLGIFHDGGQSAMSCLHFPVQVLDLNKHSRTLTFPLHSLAFTNTHEYKMVEIFRQHTSWDTYHYSASSKYSNSIRGDTKALSKLTSCPLESPSSFFCWLQLSVAVWARCRLITLFSQMSLSSTFLLGEVMSLVAVIAKHPVLCMNIEAEC